ncbi:MAG: IscS subfamily cysteine desulfurase [Alphaproteobacteria bacterium]|nr:IscS subfamily cysteine desulfurase [Alphaproteobacteria bacterium]
MKKENRFYMDHMSTTPCDQRVIDTMMPFLVDHFGNPHSKNHEWGWDASTAVEKARKGIASIINASPKEIIFTSGATEATNLAIKGLALFHPDKKHIVTTQIEHKCVLDSCTFLESQGFSITYVPVQKSGIVQAHDIENAIQDDTLLVSVMAANNEIGTIQPIREIGHICKKRGVFFHTDAAQAFAKMPIDVEDMCIDLLSISGHKIYGPKGIGALFLRKRGRRVRITPLMTGGNQEQGLRSGTLAPFLCVGLGEAARITWEESSKENVRLLNLKRTLWKKIQALPEILLNGDFDNALPHVLNVSFADVEGEGLMGHISEIAVSSGSACTSDSLEPSYVLRAIGVDESMAHTSLRISFGRFTTEEDILHTANRIVHAVNHLRNMSPLWEMRQNGVDISTIEWKH